MPVFRQSNKRIKAEDLAKTRPGFAVKYPKPKILLLDVSNSISEALISAGFNARTGSLGTPYRIEKSDGYQPLIGEADLPNYTEQEIVVVDLAIKQLGDGPDGEKHTPYGEPDLWAKCNRGLIDPRPRAAYRIRAAFDRTLSAGGVFIIFADAKTQIEIEIARCQTGHLGSLYDKQVFPFDAWDFLSECADMKVDDDHGTEMRGCDNNSSLGQSIGQHLDKGRFSCTLQGGYRSEDEWLTLAENKFGEPVALCRCRGSDGSVIILPKLANQTAFITKLFADVLPELAPHLFPHIEGGKWTHRPEYELPMVLELKGKQGEVARSAKEEIATLEAAVGRERSVNGWMHDLLTGTDTRLADGVKKALKQLGFKQVSDVDEERDKEGKARREDLQIHDLSPLLVVDVKGLGGHPADDDAFQSHKHATLRVQELKRFDVQALTIINHQRHLPALDRDNAMPFRQEILDFATEVKMGLITTWDLYRLVRGALKFGWTSEQTKPVLYGVGRIDPIPAHYTYLGTIDHVYTGVVSIQVEEGELHVGSSIAFELDVEFEEQKVTSLQIDKQPVEIAASGSRAGIQTKLQRPIIRDGMRVFLVGK